MHDTCDMYKYDFILYTCTCTMYNVPPQKKAGYIKKVSQILLDKYACDIPTTMEGLVSGLVYMRNSQSVCGFSCIECMYTLTHTHAHMCTHTHTHTHTHNLIIVCLSNLHFG